MKQFILIFALLFGTIAQAQSIMRNMPRVQGDVKEGSVNISRAKNEVTIKISSDRSLINFFEFSVYSLETVYINQPSSSSVAILRVPMGPEQMPNRFYVGGRVRSNGRLVIIAPQGVTISERGRLDASSVIITTADMKESDWQSPEFRFEDVLDYWGEIINAGTITTSGSGPITLAGDRITNEGNLFAAANTVSLVTAAAFTYSFTHNAILPESIRTVEKKQNLLNGFTKATVIYNGNDAKITARMTNVDVNIDNTSGQTPVQLGGTIEGSLQVHSKARGWLWIDGTVNAYREGSINILSTDDVWFADRAKINANTITIKADDEIRCKDTDGSEKFVSMDVSSDRGDAGKIMLEARRMTLAGKMLAVGRGNGGDITVVSGTDVIKTNLKTDVAGKTGKSGTVTFKKR